MLPFIGLILGIVLGVASGIVLPYGYSVYAAMGILACLDSVLGGARSLWEEKFHLLIFVTGFFGNCLIAMGLVWLGNRLGIDFSIAAILVFGTRIFQNFSQIRRLWLNKNKKEDMIGKEQKTEVE
ncbi:small basic family protein [Anaerotignum lactatifermentans]|uniref:Small basic family protein n=1 Tax=Anaerotignum lactatifermentans TaxID=160404 RepID=A0ABS2G6R1_9FIRM|nr:small basic family protein [Anaerotignum lactatifermentans]MBM6876720.1 small basic family protein [Anaerotignum lactatifermentans]MBM6949700.1 small basic family protein [Anaerotignum lactatifermentans]